jgi:hypothetical protein
MATAAATNIRAALHAVPRPRFVLVSDLDHTMVRVCCVALRSAARGVPLGVPCCCVRRALPPTQRTQPPVCHQSCC